MAARVVAAARTVAAREDNFKWKTAASREADTRAAAARAATWSLVRLFFVQLLNMLLLNMPAQLRDSGSTGSSLQRGKRLLLVKLDARAATWSLVRLLLVQLLNLPLLLFVQLSLLVQVAPMECGCSCSGCCSYRKNGCRSRSYLSCGCCS